MATNTSFAFAAHFPIYRDRIVSMINVSALRNGANNSIPFKCLWDTGSSRTFITPRVADVLKLDVVDETISVRTGLGGRAMAECRVAYMHVVLGAVPLKIKTAILNAPASDTDIDIVLGLDFITQGSFAISYDSGQLMFSFCYPPAPIPLDFTSMLPMLGLKPDIAISEHADSQDPEINSDVSANEINAKFNGLLRSLGIRD